MSQAEGQQKNLLHSIESLPSRGPLSSLDPDLLLLKATSAATLSCLGECLSILQHNVTQAARNITTHTPGLNTGELQCGLIYLDSVASIIAGVSDDRVCV